jgi:hypothetical protein
VTGTKKVTVTSWYSSIADKPGDSHFISVPPEDSDIYRHDLSVGADIFGAQTVVVPQKMVGEA